MARSTRSQRREAAKRAVLGAIDENRTIENKKTTSAEKTNPGQENKTKTRSAKPLEDLDGSNQSHVVSLIDDIEEEVNKRKTAIDSDVESTCLQLESVKQCAMMKLPKAVRKITMKQFKDQYQCEDLFSICNIQTRTIMKQKAEGIVSSGCKRVRVQPGEPFSAMKADEYGRSLRTPARVYTGASGFVRTPATIRTARSGEVLFSANGSPIEKEKKGDLIFSVKKLRSNTGASIASESVFDVNVGDDNFVNLKNSASLKTLAPEMQETAYNKLKVLQDEVAELMAQVGQWWTTKDDTA